jgi:anti-anti-sigma regulatory factor
MTTTFTVVQLDGAALIWADESLGAEIAVRLHEVLQKLETNRATPVVVDLVRVPELDGSVVSVLAAAASRAGERGRGLELRLARGFAATVRTAAQLRLVLRQVYPSVA